jgi:S-adenosylmethionine hydrolase
MEWDIEIENTKERLNGRKGRILSRSFMGADVFAENGENLFLTNDQFEYIMPEIEISSSQTKTPSVK